jgi:hypothetical protein
VASVEAAQLVDDAHEVNGERRVDAANEVSVEE